MPAWAALQASELHDDRPGPDVLPDHPGGRHSQVTKRQHNQNVTSSDFVCRLYAKSWIDSFLPKDFSNPQSNGDDLEKPNGESQKMLHHVAS